MSRRKAIEDQFKDSSDFTEAEVIEEFTEPLEVETAEVGAFLWGTAGHRSFAPLLLVLSVDGTKSLTPVP